MQTPCNYVQATSQLVNFNLWRTPLEYTDILPLEHNTWTNIHQIHLQYLCLTKQYWTRRTKSDCERVRYTQRRNFGLKSGGSGSGTSGVWTLDPSHIMWHVHYSHDVSDACDGAPMGHCTMYGHSLLTMVYVILWLHQFVKKYIFFEVDEDHRVHRQYIADWSNI